MVMTYEPLIAGVHEYQMLWEHAGGHERHVRPRQLSLEHVSGRSLRRGLHQRYPVEAAGTAVGARAKGVAHARELHYCPSPSPLPSVTQAYSGSVGRMAWGTHLVSWTPMAPRKPATTAFSSSRSSDDPFFTDHYMGWGLGRQCKNRVQGQGLGAHPTQAAATFQAGPGRRGTPH
jgi:hypothetical protein